MALLKKLFHRKPPDGLLEISERVYVFECCFSTDVLDDEEYKTYVGGIVAQLRDRSPDASFMVFNFREGENQSQIANILSEYDMTVMDYPRQYEGCPLLKMEMIHHFLRSSESWLSLGQQNLLLMHCERGGWPVLAFMLASLLIYREKHTSERKTLDMIYKQAPWDLLHLLSPLNPLPSQLRYLQYISRRNVASEWPPLDRALTLDCVILRMLPNFDGEGGCRPIIRIYGQDPSIAGDPTPKLLFSTPKRSKAIRLYRQDECELVKIDIHCHVQGDVVLECISLDDDLEREVMMFRVMFNTAFIRSNILMLNRNEIDILWDAKDRFPNDFRAEVLLSEMDTAASVITVDLASVEEKEGLPIEAFEKVHEIFNNVDWLDGRGDAALQVLHQITSSNVLPDRLEIIPPQKIDTEVTQQEASSPELSLSAGNEGSSAPRKSHSLPVPIRRKSTVPITNALSDSTLSKLQPPIAPLQELKQASNSASPPPPEPHPLTLGRTSSDKVQQISVPPPSHYTEDSSPKKTLTSFPPSRPPPPINAPSSSSIKKSEATTTRVPSPPPPPTKTVQSPKVISPVKRPPPLTPYPLPRTNSGTQPPTPPPPPTKPDSGLQVSSPPLLKPASGSQSPTPPSSRPSLGRQPPPPPPPPSSKSSSEPQPPSPPPHLLLNPSSGTQKSSPAPPEPPAAPTTPHLPISSKGRGLSRSTSPKSAPTSSKKTSLKPLHWVKVTRATQGSMWAEAQKTDEAIKPPEFDMSELENLFSAVGPNSDKKDSTDRSSRRAPFGQKSDKVHLIDLRRANNCEIMLTQVKIPLPDLMSSVLALDDSFLDVDQVDNLIKFCPTKEEMDLLKGYNGDKENLGKCEQFFLELMKVPRVESKLRVFSFKIQFSTQVSDLRSNLNIVNAVAQEVRNSVKLKRIMQTILSLGNALNQGTARGSAVGFKLDSLLKLTDTRARNNKMTLMHYLSKVIAEKLPELLDFPKDLTSLEAASKIQLKSLAEEMQAISKGLEKVEQELIASENDGPVSQTFHKTLKEFLVGAEAEARSLTSLYSAVGRNADSLALYFGEDPARCPFEQVVSTLLNFMRMFGRAHEENCKQLELEKKKALKEAENEKSKLNAQNKDPEFHSPTRNVNTN